MQTALDQHIELTPGVRGGKPCIAGTRIAVGDIVLMHLRLGQSLEEIAGRYDLPPAGVHAAMAFYYDHREEIEARMEEEEAFVEAFARNNPSLLQAKLKALSGEPVDQLVVRT